jgi:hypothetical protein
VVFRNWHGFSEGDDFIGFYNRDLVRGFPVDLFVKAHLAFLCGVGIEPKLEVMLYEEGVQLPEFCAMRFAKMKWGWVALPDIKRALKRLSVTTKVPKWAPSSMARMKAAAALILWPDVSIINQWARAMLRMYPRGRVTEKMVIKQMPWFQRESATPQENHKRIVEILRSGNYPQSCQGLNGQVSIQLNMRVDQLEETLDEVFQVLSGSRKSFRHLKL